MKNKKGFTLVELLAVIAILAIMVIIALPNVLEMFNNAKKSAFETELKNIYSSAEKKYINDSLNSSGTKIYSFCKSENCAKQLSLSGGNDVEYYIEFDSNGKINKYYATNGSYQYKYTGSGLSITDIKVTEFVPKLKDDDVLVVTCTGANVAQTYYLFDVSNLSVGNEVSSEAVLYSSYQDMVSSTGQQFFVKANVKNNIVQSTEFVFLLNGNEYSTKNTKNTSQNMSEINHIYYENKQVLYEAFGRENCREYAYELDCKIGDFKIYTFSNTSTRGIDNNFRCDSSYSDSQCYRIQ